MTPTGSSIRRSAACAPFDPASARGVERVAASGHDRVLADHEEAVQGDEAEHDENPYEIVQVPQTLVGRRRTAWDTLDAPGFARAAPRGRAKRNHPRRFQQGRRG